MAVTNEKSTEYNKVSDPRTYGRMSAEDTAQKVHFQEFNFTQGAAAGDATSTMAFFRFEPGRYKFFPRQSTVQWSAFGASRVLDIGIGAYTAEDGAAVSAAANSWDDNIDVSAAGIADMGSDLAAGTGGAITILSSTAFDVYATVAGGTIPIAATLNGHIAFAKVGS